MIDLDDDHILMIEPKGAPSAEPVIDDVTRRFTAAYRASKPGSRRYRGWHDCTGAGCQATSDNADHYITAGMMTNSLAIHYLACHRADVPRSEIEKVLALPDRAADPTADEVAGRNSP